MLTAADIAAAKLIHQLRPDALPTLLAGLREIAADDEDLTDLIAWLQRSGQLDEAQVVKIRRLVALFELVRHEAAYLRVLEQRAGIPRHEVHDLIARIEQTDFRHRLGPLLLHTGRLRPEQHERVEQRIRAQFDREDQRMVARYLTEDFQGVVRPLVRQGDPADPSSYRVSSLFRTASTQRIVGDTLRKLRESAAEQLAVAPRDAFPPEDEDFEPDEDFEEDDEAELEDGRRGTTRMLKKLEGDAAGLRQRETVGDYEIVECLGQGGMGAVYLCQERAGPGLVAVKVTLAERAAADDLARFHREIELVKRVSHPHVVQLIDEGRTADGLLYMVLPVYPGKSLADVLKDKDGPLAPARAFAILEQVLEGLAAIHAQQIVHRDLKPDNVFVLAGKEADIRIVDLGIARLMDGAPAEDLFKTKVGVISGSPAYVAPETIAGGALDARTDLYSFGVMAYELFTGRLPLYAESAYEYLQEHLVGVPRTLRQIARDVPWPDELERLIAQLLAKEPGDRPSSCAETLEALRVARSATEEALARPAEPEEVGKSSLFNSFFKMLGPR